MSTDKKHQRRDLLRVIYTAGKFVSWYRNMVIEGQITSTDYAQQCKPCDDYNLARALEFYGKEVP